MLHENNTNTANIEKLLEQARKRKPVMELEEIETLLQNKDNVKKAAVKWQNIFLLVLTLFIGAGISWYFISDKPVITAERSASQINKSENDFAAPADERNSNSEFKENNNELNVAENQTIYEQHNINRNFKDRHLQNNGLKIENNTAEGSKSVTSDSRQAMPNSTPAPAKESGSRLTFKGWELGSKVPSQFKYGLDDEVVYNGDASAYISSKKSNYNSAWLTQEISAAPYAGKRLKMSAMVKSSNVGKKAWAGIFLNIKGNDFKKAGFDNLYDKNIGGQTDWVRCKIVMDIPAESKTINFGLYKVYGGDAWIDDIQLDIVNADVPIHYKSQTEAQDTSLVQPDISSTLTSIIVSKPSNLDFEKQVTQYLPDGWHIGEEKQHFRAMADNNIFHSGKASVFLQSSGYIEKDWNTLMQYCRAGDYQGKRLKLTAWVRTEDLKEYAQFIFRVDGIKAIRPADKIKEFTFTGNNNWRKVELILDIPEEATHISYGLLLTGKGKVWMDDITIEEVAADSRTRNKPGLKSPVNLGFEE